MYMMMYMMIMIILLISLKISETGHFLQLGLTPAGCFLDLGEAGLNLQLGSLLSLHTSHSKIWGG
jgi:hypothetical protein